MSLFGIGRRSAPDVPKKLRSDFILLARAIEQYVLEPFPDKPPQASRLFWHEIKELSIRQAIDLLNSTHCCFRETEENDEIPHALNEASQIEAKSDKARL